MKKQNIISWIALTLSIIACIITLIRVDVTVANDSFISMIAGFMGVCATLLVGSQIYNSIETSRRIKELDDKLQQTQSALLEARKDNDRFEHYTRYRLYLQVGMSMGHTEPVFAFTELFYALREALRINDSLYTKRVLNEIDTICKRIIKKPPFKPSSKFNYENYSPEKLKKYDLYPLIKDKYQGYYNSIVNLYKQCQEQSQTAS
ncbi:hypothetical protein QUW56_02580 [Phocaeicola barnesiae]|uniref:hypothetical protein n=1 Tax=Phocaeicola barnesiae TaxID=376804 RepID=UPI0025A49C9E|nr:hypothetical protein [Phocaeicola barnesiae]MDM8232284.1 hypothetical protein [Phocaeicola barnesiae]